MNGGSRHRLPYPAPSHWSEEGALMPARPDWLEGELFERRLVFVAGRLETTLAMRAAAELMTLDASGSDAVDVYIESSGGTIEAAFTLIDTLDLLVAPTRIHVLGEVGGAALGVLAAGRRRTAAANAGFHLAEPVLRVNGTTGQMLAWGQQQQLLLQRFHERLAQATGKAIDEVTHDLEHGRYLDSAEALDYGLVHEIGDPKVARHGARGD